MRLLDVQGITKRFAGINALTQVDLHVDEGEFVGLIGPNGAGKTTLFNCLSGVTRPDDGRVLLRDRDITGLPTHERASLGIGRTFQRMELFGGMTVRDHLVVAARARSGRTRMGRDLLGQGGLSADERTTTDAMLELLGLLGAADRPIESLTLGRARLVELARALMTEPTLLFLDEPSSGLDQYETDEMARVLTIAQEVQGTAILLIEHDLAFVQRVASRLYVLDYGKLIASGPTGEVLTRPEVREAYLGVMG
jgi:branched-chain amino acid transport system ATP-binding protein